MKFYKKYIKPFFKSRILKTIWFNWKLFPINIAWKLPVYLYGRTKFRSLKGTVLINGYISPGMIKIGKNDYYIDTSVQQCIWTIRGTVVFNGPVNFGHGSYVLVSDNATLEFGTKGDYFGSNLKIMCFDHISFGDDVRVTWDCQFYDSSFHYIELLSNNGEIKPLTKPILIGDRVWIGNRTTISKGSVIPSDIFISSNSLVNKDFSQTDPYSMLAGCPASLKCTGIKRIYDEKRQKELDKQFLYFRTHL